MNAPEVRWSAAPRLRRSTSWLLMCAVMTFALTLAGGGTAAIAAETPEASAATASPVPSGGPETEVDAPERPEWFDLEMVDVHTGEPFTMNDFAGKVVLVQAMAVWCPTCREQGDEIGRLHELLGDPSDLVSVSLDVDMGEDESLLRDYAESLGFEWRFAVAPLLVARALGNLYSAQYLNPPLSPMLIIDRSGDVLGLPYGLKSAEALEGVVAPLLAEPA